ncbi:MAG: Calx-beta domain-containing protein, partial [Bacteroidota bacterium]
IQFTLIDSTGGVSVTNFGDTFGYTVLEGDSVRVIGEMDDFNGLAQLDPDNIIFVSSGNALVTPAIVDSLGEVTESELIRINNVFLVDPSQWPASGNANVEISTGQDTLIMRIDGDTDIPGTPAPAGLFDVIGLGGQFDNTVPRTEGYQILPRTQMDIIPAPAPGFSLSPTSASVAEDTGMVSFEVELANAFPDPTSVSVSLTTDGTATDGLDFSGWTDTILTFPAGITGPFQLDFTVNDDNLVEGDETIVFELSSPMGGPVLGDSVLTINIEDNDYTPYDIDVVTADDNGDGLPDSLGVRCELRGIVHGMDQQGDNINFVFIDSTGGIAAFQFNFDDYVVEEGDEVVVRGFIDEFRGLAQIRIEEIVEVSEGNPIFSPMVVDSLGEFTESEYIRMECMRLVDTADWNTGGSFNIDITNGVDTFVMRIDADVDARMSPRPDKPFNVTGLGWQFTFDTPAINGYQIIPQFMTDIEILPDPSVGFATDSITVGEADGSLDALLTMLQGNGLEVDVDIAVDAANTTATAGDDYSFTAGTLTFSACGEDSLTQTVTVVDDGVTEAAEFLTLILSNPTSDATLDQATLVITIIDGTTNLPSLSTQAIQMFPNPTQGQLELRSDFRMETVTVYNLIGKQVMNASPQADQASLNVENLPAGIYTVKVETPEGTWNSKLIRK